MFQQRRVGRPQRNTGRLERSKHEERGAQDADIFEEVLQTRDTGEVREVAIVRVRESLDFVAVKLEPRDGCKRSQLMLRLR